MIQLIPAIDLKGGNIVRLYQGKTDEKVYSRNPQVVARHWKKQGAQLLHVVDLDGAFTGTPKNLPLLKKIIDAVDVPVEFGGGVRTMETVRQVMGMGVARVVVGTSAVEDRTFLRAARAKFADKIIVSIDARDGVVMTRGWQEVSSQKKKAVDFALQLKDEGFKEAIYTDTSKDGTLRGPNIPSIQEFLSKCGLRVIVSGGVSCLDDIIALSRLEPMGLSGIIIGKALYEDRFTLKEALKCLNEKEEGV